MSICRVRRVVGLTLEVRWGGTFEEDYVRIKIPGGVLQLESYKTRVWIYDCDVVTGDRY